MKTLEEISMKDDNIKSYENQKTGLCRYNKNRVDYEGLSYVPYVLDDTRTFPKKIPIPKAWLTIYNENWPRFLRDIINSI